MLFCLAALWVPVNRDPVPEAYYQISWRQSFQPRALLGTLSDILGLTGRRFVQLSLAGQILFLFLLLEALSRAGPRRAGGGEERVSYLGLAALAVLLSFQQVLFLGNFFSGFTDVHSYVLILLALRALSTRADPGPGALALATALSFLALLNHEKSLFDAAVLAAWLAFRFGLRPAAAYFLPLLLSLLALMRFTSEDSRIGLAFYEYGLNLARARRYLAEESGSLIGIFYGGGMLYVLWLSAAVALCRDNMRARMRSGLRALVFVVVTAGLCLAPLLIAHDTNRLVGMIWLPSLLLLRETRFVGRMARGRRWLGATVALAGLQLALPPVFVFKHGAIPLNCYAQRAVRALCAGRPGGELVAWGGLLRLYEDEGHREYYQRRCLVLSLYRNPKVRKRAALEGPAEGDRGQANSGWVGSGALRRRASVKAPTPSPPRRRPEVVDCVCKGRRACWLCWMGPPTKTSRTWHVRGGASAPYATLARRLRPPRPGERNGEKQGRGQGRVLQARSGRQG